MRKWRFDRISIFFFVVVVLYLWELIYFTGITDPAHLPHPFRLFSIFGDSDSFLGSRIMLRQMIFWGLPSSLAGIVTAHVLLRNSRIAEAAARFLRLGIWIPIFLLFTILTATFEWIIAAAVLFSCYNYLIARLFLDFRGHAVLVYAGRETLLQMLLLYLIAQLWLGYWKWFDFAPLFQLSVGFQVLATVVIFLLLINWIFQSSFEIAAEARAAVLRKEIRGGNWCSLTGAVLITTCCLLIWQAFAFLWLYGASVAPIGPVSPLDVFRAAGHLFGTAEIWSDIGISLKEIFLGFVLCCSVAIVVNALSVQRHLRIVIFFLLPLTYISSIVVYLLVFILELIYVGPAMSWINFWHKVVAVGLLTFFPFFQAFWGLRNQPKLYRILQALDDALPFAFVAMLFGEAWAATAGLGFMMIIASATFQWDKALAGFLITTVLFVGLSAALRCIARRLYSPGAVANATPVNVT